MASNVIFLKKRIDKLLSSLSTGSFTDSVKNDFDYCLESLESLKVDREVLQTTRIGSSLTKLSKSLENHCKDSSIKVVKLIERWKNQLRSLGSSNPAKRQKTLDCVDSALGSEKLVVPDFKVPTFSDSLNKNFSLSNQFLKNPSRDNQPQKTLTTPNLYHSKLPDSTEPAEFVDSSTLDEVKFADDAGSLTSGVSQRLKDSFTSSCDSTLDDSTLNGKVSSEVTGDSTREADKDDDLDLPVYSGPLHGDPLRDKALRYLFRCFLIGQDFGPELNKLNELIYEIENGLYDHYVVNKNEKKEYNMQLKCISFNLKDVKNTFFNYKVYSGIISVSELVTMSSLQMASDEKKLQRSEILEQSLEACQSDWAIKNIFLNQKSKGQFKCGKCNSRQTTYYQLQTRSSDEPMTTFVTCLNCKNRWRF